MTSKQHKRGDTDHRGWRWAGSNFVRPAAFVRQTEALKCRVYGKLRNSDYWAYLGLTHNFDTDGRKRHNDVRPHHV